MAATIMNVSKKVREFNHAGVAVFTKTGAVLQRELMKEFNTLANETAQWSGTTVSSWNITLGGVGDGGGYYPQPEVPYGSWIFAKEKGDQGTTSAVIYRNQHNLDRLTTMGLPGQKGNSYRAIMVENYTPWAAEADEEPMRKINRPAGAFKRFKIRVANLIASVEGVKT